MTDPHKDEHIEELLGKLQGIFGKLSHSEEEEAKQKISVPAPAPKEKEPEAEPEHDHVPERAGLAPPKSAAPIPLNLYGDPIAEPPVLAPAPLPTPEAAPAPAPAPTPAPAPAPPAFGTYESTVPAEDPEKMIVPSAIFYLPGREAEGRSLAQKLETLTPKFTKVAFRLRIGVFLPYDPKSEWKDLILAQAANAHFQTVFILVDRPLDDARRKVIAADLEAQNIYFQEVPLASIEKKAFYTDVLLGLVFFFDSQKPKTDEEGSAA